MFDGHICRICNCCWSTCRRLPISRHIHTSHVCLCVYALRRIGIWQLKFRKCFSESFPQYSKVNATQKAMQWPDPAHTQHTLLSLFQVKWNKLWKTTLMKMNMDWGAAACCLINSGRLICMDRNAHMFWIKRGMIAVCEVVGERMQEVRINHSKWRPDWRWEGSCDFDEPTMAVWWFRCNQYRHLRTSADSLHNLFAVEIARNGHRYRASVGWWYALP